MIQIGKCEGCNQVVYNVNNMTEDINQKMKTYDVKSVPTTVIDSTIKIVDIPDFSWICSEKANHNIFININNPVLVYL